MANARDWKHEAKHAVGGVVGNVLEWYDFAVYGFLAPYIGKLFFPPGDALSGLIESYGVFAAGYLMRPVGGVLFGWIGDRFGRKRALELSVLLMALPTTAMGLLPTYETVGLWAPVLLTLCRIVQGISIGGELIGSVSFVVEHAAPRRRGLVGSTAFFSVTAGILLGSLLIGVVDRLFTPAELTAWAWRVPFLFGVLTAAAAVYIRLTMDETPHFEARRAAGDVPDNPLGEALRTGAADIVRLAVTASTVAVGFQMTYFWLPGYMAKVLVPPIPHPLDITSANMIALMVVIPVAALLSDYVGRKPVMIAGTGVIALGAAPLFRLFAEPTATDGWIVQGVLTLGVGALLGPIGTAMIELFPGRIRFTAVAVGYNLPLAIIGGTAPMFVTWLIKATGDPLSPGLYLSAVGAASTIALFTWPETRHRDLHET